MKPTLKNDYNKETEDAIYFYTPDYYVFDNFSAYTVEIWGKEFKTAEHAYQWKKFVDTHPEIAEEIYAAKSPSEVKKISDQYNYSVASEFHEHKLAIMEEIIRAKYHQHEKVQRMLATSGTKNIIENSPSDSFWGIGPDESGQNMLGKLWMKIRDEEILC
jgi:N-glycosidase YbiA